MSNPRLRERLETYTLVSIITLLVWLYAESENIRSYTDFPMTVSFVPTGDKMLVEPEGPQRVTLAFTASQNVHDAMRRLHTEGGVRIEMSEDPLQPHQRVLMLSALNALPALASWGVTLERVEPATLDVRVERLVTRTLPVTVIAGEVQLASPPTITPASVDVTLPAGAAARLGGLTLEARLQNAEGYPQWAIDEPYERAVPLTLPEPLRGQRAQLATDRVTVGFTVRKLTRELMLPRVRLVIESPLGLLNEFAIRLPEGQDQVVRDVRLSGPSDLIERIEKNEIEIAAVLKLKPEDLQVGKRSKLLFITKPDSVRVLSELPRVEYEVLRRQGPTP